MTNGIGNELYILTNILILLNGVKLPFGYYKKNIHLRLQ